MCSVQHDCSQCMADNLLKYICRFCKYGPVYCDPGELCNGSSQCPATQQPGAYIGYDYDGEDC